MNDPNTFTECHHTSRHATQAMHRNCNATRGSRLGSPAETWLVTIGLLLIICSCVLGAALARKWIHKQQRPRYRMLEEADF